MALSRCAFTILYSSRNPKLDGQHPKTVSRRAPVVILRPAPASRTERYMPADEGRFPSERKARFIGPLDEGARRWLTQLVAQ